MAGCCHVGPDHPGLASLLDLRWGQAPHLLLAQGREAVPGVLSNTRWIYGN